MFLYETSSENVSLSSFCISYISRSLNVVFLESTRYHFEAIQFPPLFLINSISRLSSLLNQFHSQHTSEPVEVDCLNENVIRLLCWMLDLGRCKNLKVKSVLHYTILDASLMFINDDIKIVGCINDYVKLLYAFFSSQFCFIKNTIV